MAESTALSGASSRLLLPLSGDARSSGVALPQTLEGTFSPGTVVEPMEMEDANGANAALQRRPSMKDASKWLLSRASIQAKSFSMTEPRTPHILPTDSIVVRFRRGLLPWVKWLPIEILALLILVAPPLVAWGTAEITGSSIFGSDVHTHYVIRFCTGTCFIYLSLRIFATSSQTVELVLFSTWCGIILLLFASMSMKTNIFALLSAIVVGIYGGRLLVLSHEIRSKARQLVSKKKRRFVDTRNGIDLDLTYISRRIIAMGFPSQFTVESQYRNSMEEVQRFFELRHKDHYKVFNLCSERAYTHKCFYQEFHDCRWPDFNPCPLRFLEIICKDMKKFQDKDKTKNVIAVHCKAGKSRTGMVISAYLLHIRVCKDANEAIETFGNRRSFNGNCVTIPSQIRYVHHYEVIVREGKMRPPVWLCLRRIETSPALPSDCRFQMATHEEGKIYDSKAASASNAKVTSTKEPLLEGDVKFVFFRGKSKMFHFWIHTAYDAQECDQSAGVSFNVGNLTWQSAEEQKENSSLLVLALPRSKIDGAHKKSSKVDKNFGIRVVFERPSQERQVEAEASRVKRKSQADKEAVETARRATAGTHGSFFGQLPRASTNKTRSESKHAGSKVRTSAASIIAFASAPVQAIRATIGEPATADVEDDDAIANETDEEEMQTTLHRGYLYRSAGCFSSRVKRWCEVTTEGALHIAGNTVHHGGLVVNLAEGEDGREVLQPTPNVANSWKVRNPNTSSWETLEAEENQGKHWDQAFSDSVRLGIARRSPETAFGGFFWKLNRHVDENAVRQTFEYADWRVRLFVLQKDGKVLVYSSKMQSEEVYCDLAEESCSVEKMDFQWPNAPGVVPFQIFQKGQPPKILASREEDFNLFMGAVVRLQCRVRSSRSQAQPGIDDIEESTIDAEFDEGGTVSRSFTT